MKIAFTTELPAEGFTRLEGHTLYAPLEEAEVLVSTFDKPVMREMIMSAPKLKLVTNFGVGFNNIDLEACRERGIRVTNTPKPVIEPTAELAFALMHDVARRTAEFDRKLRAGQAEPFGVMNNLSHSLYGKTLGIIGMGRIGQALARRALAAGMTIIYHNRRPLGERREAKGEEAKYVTKDELLQTADFVSLNLPYTPEVKHLIGENELRMMKPTAYLINTARGAHVDEQAFSHMAIRPSHVPVPVWGDKTTLSSCNNSDVICGSCSYTSIAAPAISPSFNALTNACSSTCAPRAVLIRYAVGFIILSSFSPIKCFTSGV